jgi:signal transduction histidine kinase
LFAAAPFVGPGVAMVALAWTGARVGTVAAVLALAGMASAIQVIAYDPFWEPGCTHGCVNVAPPAGGLISHADAVTASSTVMLASSVVAAALVLRHRAPRALTLATLLALGVTGSVAALGIVLGESVATARVRVVLQVPALAASVGLALVVVRAVRTRRTLREIVTTLGQGAAAENGPEANVAFEVAEGRWVNAQGLPVARPGPAQLVGSGIAVVHIERDSRHPGKQAGTLSPGAVWSAADWLVLENARRSATTRAHRREVAASQRRIVLQGDQALRRIAADLHDGAQQRLVGVKLHVAMAHSEVPTGERSKLADAEQHLQDALARLRALTHSAFPRLVETDGLEPALAELIADVGAPIALHVEDIPDRLPLSSALAAYFVVAAASDMSRHSPSPSGVWVHGGGDRVTITISPGQKDSPESVWPDDVIDRVDALGGTLCHTETVTTVEIPCA